MKVITEKITLFIVILIYKLLNILLNIFKSILFQTITVPKEKDVKRILIFRVGGIGDTICAIPAMVSIRENFPNAEIILLSSPGTKDMPGAKELLQNAIFLNKLKIYYQEDIDTLTNKINILKSIINENIDLFIELPSALGKFRIFLRDILFSKMIGSKYAFGFEVSTLKLFKHIQSKYIKLDNEVIRLTKILERNHLNVSKISFPVSISEQDKNNVNKILENIESSKLIAVNPNAKRQTNKWQIEKFAEISKWLIDNYSVTILILGGINDFQKTEEMRKMVGHDSINLAGKISLIETIELLKRCKLLISNDTGTGHMAAVANIPLISIYSARDFKHKWYPYGDHNTVLRKDIKCDICFKEYCQKIDCLKLITVDDIKTIIQNNLLINE